MSPPGMQWVCHPVRSCCVHGPPEEHVGQVMRSSCCRGFFPQALFPDARLAASFCVSCKAARYAPLNHAEAELGPVAQSLSHIAGVRHEQPRVQAGVLTASGSVGPVQMEEPAIQSSAARKDISFTFL